LINYQERKNYGYEGLGQSMEEKPQGKLYVVTCKSQALWGKPIVFKYDKESDNYWKPERLGEI